MKYKDYYATLDVARDANLDLVKKAYRKLARQYHPDMSKEAGAEAKFKEAAEAYATLKDPEKRAAYDALGRRPAGQEFAPPPQWEQSHRAAQGSTQGFEDIDLADLMGAFGRRGHGDHGGQQAFALAGRDYDSKLAISLLDAHRGATLNLQLSADGEDRTLEVTVPAGVREGQKLRLRGKGGKGRNGGPDGDIYLHITLAPHAIFRADHHDLYFDLVLSPWEAALGSEIEVPTLDGPVMLTVPPGTHWGRKLRLRARGLAKGGDDGRGDLYALVHIDVPGVLSAEERTLYEQLGQVSAFRPRETAVKGEPNASPHR